MNNFFKNTRSLIFLSGVVCITLVLLIWSQICSSVAEDRDKAIATAVQRNSNLAVSLEQYAIRTIRNADAFLQLVKLVYDRNSNTIDLNALLEKGVIDAKDINGVALIDENGKIIKTNMSLSKDSLLNFSDREHFYFHKTHNDQLFLSKPIFSRTIGREVIVVSRRINKPGGSFGGTIALQIEPSTFTRFYSKANLRPHDIISLISPDGITYARRTGNVESFGENIIKSPLFAHVHVTPVGNYFAKDAIHFIPTYFSFRKLTDYPIIATVGTAENDVLADHYLMERREYLFGTIITVLLLFFVLLANAISIQRKKSIEIIGQAETRYRSIFENSQDAVITALYNGQVEAMNPSALKLFGVDPARVTSMDLDTVFKDIFPAITLQDIDTLQDNKSKKEFLFTRSDNTLFTGELVYSGYRDANGNDRYVILIRDISLRKQMEQRLLMEQKRYQRRLTRQIILAQELEREKIGHELHDNVNQILTTVKLYLEMAMNNEKLRDDLLPKSILYVMNCITEIRNLSRELSAPTLGTKSVIDSIKALVEMVESSARFNISFVCDDYHTAIIKDQKLALYRILQEQLNNIIKHSDATHVDITLLQTGNMTELTIVDNGNGFNLSAHRNGIGLNNILSRAKVFGGEMVLSSKPGAGCSLKVVMPILVENIEADTVHEEG
jgi:PAS domain S-box-containing protein